MRNLKRVLSLALAVVMVIGMMVMTTGAADLTDADEIKYIEAVEVAVALGLIEGNPDGSFNPNGILTRAGAAKLICYMLMGPETAEKLPGGSDFTDVKATYWAAPYINYCASLGYIAGNGDGTFNPNGKLTGVAFAKLLLCALGYDAEIEGYVNNKNYATNIGIDAIEAGINIEGVDLSAQLTREQAAQMILNTLTADMVKYDDKGSSITIGGVEIVTGASEAEVKTNTTTNYDKDVAAATDGKLQFCEKHFTKLTVKATTDDFGRAAHTWYYGDTELPKDTVGQYVNKAAATVLVTGMKNDTLGEIADELGRELATGLSKTTSYNKGVSVEIYTNNVGKISAAIPMTTKLAKITKVTETTDKDAKFTYTVNVSVNGSADSYKDTELEGFDAETMVKDTYVTIVEGTNTAIVALADKVTGTITATGGAGATKTEYLKVDGEKVEYATTRWTINAVDYTNIFDVYVDANGYVIGTAIAEKVKEDTAIFYVKGSAIADGTLLTGGDKAKLEVINLDGTTEAVDMVIDSDGKVSINGVDTAVNTDPSVTAGFYEYTVDEDGNIKSIKTVGTSGTAGDNAGVKDTKELADTKKVTFAENSAVVTIEEASDATYYADADTTVVTIKNGKATTVTGYNNFTDTNYTAASATPVAVLYTYSGNALKTVYVIGGTAMAADEDTVLGVYISTGDTYSVKGVTYKDVVYNVAGENVTYRVASGATAHKFAEIDVNALGVATLTNATAEDKAMYQQNDKAVTKVTDSYILVKGSSDPVYFASSVTYYDVTNIAKNGVVADDAVVVGDIINYTLKQGKIDTVYTTCAAKEDGTIALSKNNTADVAYFATLGLNPAALSGLSDTASYAVVQYSRPANSTSETFNFVFWNVETPASTTTWNLNAGYTNPAIGEGVLISSASGSTNTYDYQIVFDGTVIQTGTFTLSK